MNCQYTFALSLCISQLLMTASTGPADEIYFNVPSQLGDAIPYKLLVAGRRIASANEASIHRRYHQHVMILTIDGIGSIQLQQQRFSAHKGTIAWVDTSIQYSHGCDSDADNWTYLWMAIQGYGLDSLLNLLFVRSNPLFQPRNFDELAAQFSEVMLELCGSKVIPAARGSAVVANLLASLVDNRGIQNYGLCNSGWQRKLIETVRSDISHHWSVSELACISNLSTSQLFRKFKRYVGTSPMDWIRHERLNQAKSHLVESTDRIATVALRCGYSDPYHFSRDFRRIFGQSPTEFRRQNSPAYKNR